MKKKKKKKKHLLKGAFPWFIFYNYIEMQGARNITFVILFFCEILKYGLV